MTTATPPRSGIARDDGSSALELVLLTPALIALVFAIVQAALLWNAKHTVGAAAQHGARLARTLVALQPAATTAPASVGSADTDGTVQASTLRFLRQTGGSSLADATVIVGRDGQYVTVTVSGTSVGVLPGTTVRGSGSSRTPVEGFRP